MTKAPYTFPLRSRAAMTDYVRGRMKSGRSYYGRTFPFVWNVKAYRADFDGDSLRRAAPDMDLQPRFDAKWQAIVESDTELFWHFCESAGQHLSGGEWTSYPGSDQGDWQFSFAGRSGGWLVLEKWRGIDVCGLYSDPQEAAEYRKSGYCPQDGGCNIDNWSFDQLRAFYRGLVCADSDFTPDKASSEVMYQAAFYRGQLETDWLDAETRCARRQEAERPDMYLPA